MVALIKPQPPPATIRTSNNTIIQIVFLVDAFGLLGLGAGLRRALIFELLPIESPLF